jgi:glycosyltransferase involved in cell wall biosynthesis
LKNITYIISDIGKALAFEWIAERINKEKFQLRFILIVQQQSQLETFLTGKNISCEVFYYTSKKDFPGLFIKVYRSLKKNKADVVHTHLITASLIGLTAGKFAHVKKLIYTRHHSDYHHRYFRKGIKFDRLCNFLANKIIAPSLSVKSTLTKLENVKEEKIIIIHHGFDLNYFEKADTGMITELKQKYNPDNTFPVIGVISRFTELKGIQHIIPAFKKLLLQYPKALLLLFNANGDYKEELFKQLAELPDQNYRCIGFENELASVYRLFDVFIQASTDTNIEAFGQTYVEALAAGVPSVFTLSGIAADFINGNNAVVVPFRDPDAIYSGIVKILTDPSFAKKIAAQGLKDVQSKFSIDVMIGELENIYES